MNRCHRKARLRTLSLIEVGSETGIIVVLYGAATADGAVPMQHSARVRLRRVCEITAVVRMQGGIVVRTAIAAVCQIWIRSCS